MKNSSSPLRGAPMPGGRSFTNSAPRASVASRSSGSSPGPPMPCRRASRGGRQLIGPDSCFTAARLALSGRGTGSQPRPTGATFAHSSSEYSRERSRKRRPSALSSEKAPPRPGTASMMSWVCSRVERAAFQVAQQHVGAAHHEFAQRVAHGRAAIAAAAGLVKHQRAVLGPQRGDQVAGRVGGDHARRGFGHGVSPVARCGPGPRRLP